MYLKILSLILTACFSTTALSQDLSSQRTRPQTRLKARPGQARPVEVRPEQKTVPKADDRFFTRYIINAGTHTEFMNDIQTDSSGTTNKFEISPTLGIGFFIPITSELNFLPEINWVLPRTDEDSGSTENTLMLRADWGYDPVDFFRVRVGTSIMWLNQHGKGGSTKINNGNTSSTFYHPDENRSSFNNTLDVGAELLLGEWAVRLQTYTYAVFKEERRKVSYTLFLSYYWDR